MPRPSALPSGGPLIGPIRNVLFPDFLTFHAAVRAFIEGKLALAYDIDPLTRFHNEVYADRFPWTVNFRLFFRWPRWLPMPPIPTLSMLLNGLDALIMPLVILRFGTISWSRPQALSKVELPTAAATR